MFKRILILTAFLIFPVISFSQLPNWVEQNSGTTQTLTSVHFDSYFSVWACGYGGTVIRSTNKGTNWINVGGNGIPATAQLINIVVINANIALTSGYIGSNTFVYRTSNAGTNWTQVFTENNGFINAMCFNSFTDGFMTGDPVGGRWSLWRTTNGGINWDSSGLYLPQIGTEAGWNNSVWINNGKIWFGTNNTKLYYSSNFGANWVAQPTTGSVNSYTVWFYRLFGGIDGLIGGADMFRSSNSGFNWDAQVSAGSGNFGGITGGPNVIFDAGSGGFWFTFSVRGTGEIYTSTNGGTNWFSQYTAPAGTYRYIGTGDNALDFWAVRSNGGISYLYLNLGAINTISNEVPDKFTLSQNFPNPFNPTTKIRFQLMKSSRVKLTVFDQLGREVKVLLNEQIGAGTYESEFNESDIVSGVYFYKLETGEFSEVKKMLLLK